jgi:U4/U6.U5 tri-snRNP-associated protein 2
VILIHIPIFDDEMAKRQAVESLEEVAGRDSPAPKRNRADELGFQPQPLAQPQEVNVGVTYNGEATENSHALNGQSMLSAAAETQESIANADAMSEDESEEESRVLKNTRLSAPIAGYSDLYLDTIDRSALDFDFEKLCSVSLSNINVYACLVCGKYYQGRGHSSHAYFHALDVGHHVFINMQTQKVYVLPEGYEVTNRSLEDIKFVSDPKYTKEEVVKLDRVAREAFDLQGRKYTPGFVGMNNIKANDYFNVIIQALSHVPPLRNFFMLEDFSGRPELAKRVSILFRKIWNPRAFKAHVSPHELLQEVALRSNKKFSLTRQSDPVEFLSWFLNTLHLALGGSKTKPGSSIIQQIFQGRLKVESQRITAKADAGDRLRFEEAAEVKVDISRFLLLTLDLPAAPLFQDEQEKNIIPQVPLTSILSKYDGRRAQEQLNHRRRYRLLHPLPPYLLFHVKRFSPNKFTSEERNPTIVTFDPRNLDMSPYVQPDPAMHPPGEPIWYDLVANVVLETVRGREDAVEGEEEAKRWKVQLRKREDWVLIQDLFVEEAQGGLLYLGETYLQIWERRRTPRANGKGKGK